MSARDELEQRLVELEDQPYHLQVDPLGLVVAEADAIGDEELSADARASLVSALCLGDGETSRMFAPFAWLVQRLDAPPAWWGPHHQHRVLWAYKWIVNAALKDPAVPLTTIESLVDGMAERYARHEAGLAPVLMVRYQLERHRHGDEAADEAFRAWVEEPRSTYSDCDACEPSAWVAHLAALGLHDQAVEAFWPVHSGSLTCAEQPQDMYADALASLLLTEHTALATEVHLRGTRLTRDEPGQAVIDARQLGTAARAGQLDRAVHLWERRSASVVDAKNPAEALETAAHAVVLMDRLVAAGRGDLEVADPAGGRAAVTAVRADLRGRAEELAARFDTRNGTDARSRWLGLTLAAPDLPQLELSTATRAVAGPAASGRGADHGPDEAAGVPVVGLGAGPAAPGRPLERALELPDELPEDVVELGQLATEAGTRGDHRVRRRVASHWEGLLAAGRAPVPHDDATADAVMSLDLCLCNHLYETRRRGEIAPVVARAVATARARGWEAQARALEQREAGAELWTTIDESRREAVQAVVRTAVDDIDALLEADPTAVSPESSAARIRCRARLIAAAAGCRDAETLLVEADALSAYVDQSASPRDRTMRAEVLTQAAYSHVDDSDLEAHQHDHGPQVDAARRVLVLLADGTAPDLRLQALLTSSRAALADDQVAQAVELAGVAVGVAETGGGTEEAARCAAHCSEVLLPRVDEVDAPAVTALLDRLLLLALEAGDTAAAAALRFDTALLLRRTGRDVEAAEVLEIALHEIEAADETQPHYIAVSRTRGNVALATADVALSLGETAHAARVATRAASWYDLADEPAAAVRAAETAARALDVAGDRVAASSAFRDCATRGEAIAATWPDTIATTTWAKRRIGELALAVDGRPAAEAALDEAADHLVRLGPVVRDQEDPGVRTHLEGLLAWEELSVRLARGVVRLDDRDPAGALQVLRGLDAGYAAQEDWASAIESLRLEGLAHGHLGDRSTAETTWRRAAHEADQHDLVGLREQVAGSWASWLDHEGYPDAAEAVWAQWGPRG